MTPASTLGRAATTGAVALRGLDGNGLDLHRLGLYLGLGCRLATAATTTIVTTIEIARHLYYSVFLLKVGTSGAARCGPDEVPDRTVITQVYPVKMLLSNVIFKYFCEYVRKEHHGAIAVGLAFHPVINPTYIIFGQVQPRKHEFLGIIARNLVPFARAVVQPG
jgi:hypothetical protein